MKQKIIILDFGSQTTQLIGRRVRELDTFCEILPYNKFPEDDESVIGVILSGSPFSVYDKEAFKIDLDKIKGRYPVLGICYGAQYIAYTHGGKVEPAGTREYGRANLGMIDTNDPLFKGFVPNSQVWMSHGDSITAIPEGYKVIASTDKVKYAAFASETEKILFQLRDIYENYHGVKISDEIIKLIVEFSDRYITTGRFPDKAIDILDEACSKTAIIDNTYEKKNRLLTISMNEVRNKKNKAIIDHDYKLARQLKEEQEELETLINKNFMRSTKCKSIKSINKDTLYDVIYEKTKIPVKKILKYNKNSLTLSLNKTVFGQKKAIDEILDITLSRKINKNVPISLLLVGKTGVGKTLLVKEYARLLYPKTAFIRLDMSEYKEGHSISKIIGAPAGYVGYNDNNCILEKVKDNPYSIFLIDEIEKAHTDVLRLFLQVLDTGCMTNSYGEQIDFSNVVIFMTSNLGTTNKKIGFSSDNSLVYEKFKEFLGVEFINRIDKVIYFDDIDSNTIGKIISKRAIDLGFEKDFSPELVNKIKNECNYKEFGARHVDKVLRKYVDTFTIKH